MLVVSSGKFRANQRAYFDQADEGQELLVQRGSNKSYRIVPVTENNTDIDEEYILEPDADLERAIPFDVFKEKALSHIQNLYNQRNQ